MAIRFFIDVDCPPRVTLGEDVLLHLIAENERAEILAAAYRARGESDPTRMAFTEQVSHEGSNPTPDRRTVAELHEETAPLQQFAQHCAGCPASLTGHAYGCTWSVAWPLGAVAEEWLLGLLPTDQPRTLELFLDAVARYGYGTHPQLLPWRKSGLLERAEPLRRETSLGAVDSGMLVHALFLVGDLQPGHQLGLLLHLGLLESRDGRRGDALLEALEAADSEDTEAVPPELGFALPPGAPEDPGVRDLERFLFAIFAAFRLQAPLAIRL